MKTKKHFYDIRKWIMDMILLAILLILFGCGSKKTVSQSHTKEKMDIELTDNSQINTKIEHARQFIDTHTKERIVTLYGMQMFPYSMNGDTIYFPVSYPMKKEEEREMSDHTELWKIKAQDSILNALDIKYKSQINEKDKMINEFKQSTIMYQIITVLSMGIVIIMLILLSRYNSSGWKDAGF